VPPFIETNHLTLFSLPLAITMLVSSWLAKTSFNWLALNSFLIALQYLSDALDGEVGRQRNTGLIRWGFYMDHFLDLIFATSVFIGYAIIFPQDAFLLFCIALMIAAFFAHGAFVAVLTGKYDVTGFYRIGWPEIWLSLIGLNTYIMIFQPAEITTLFMVIFATLVFGLTADVYQAQKKFWRVDMRAKKKAGQAS
jgi:phosphatidylglycerophosphate synthase